MIILPQISDKQKEITKLIYRFRFLNRAQIQNLLKHKDYKTINLWLRDLTEKHYLDYITRSQTNIYHIAKNGISYIKDSTEIDTKLLQKYYQEDRRSIGFIEKHLLIADIYLDLQKRSNDKISFDMLTKYDYQSEELIDNIGNVMPDAYIEQEISGEIKPYFLEMFLNYPKERLRQRIKRYLFYYQSNEWEEYSEKQFPSILFVCANDQILAYVKQYTKRKMAMLDEPSLSINISTADQVKEFGITGNIWKKIN
jgi:hypothetical protein